MAKNVIRLTESDLYKMIQESVDSILTELDWKTYANAAQKDKDPRRANEFARAARDKFNSEFEYRDDNESTMMTDVWDPNNLGVVDHVQNGDATDRFTTLHNPTFKDHPTSRSTRELSGSLSHGYVKRPFTQSKPHARAMQRAHDEFNAYKTGQAKYEKGKGWSNDGADKTDWHDYLDYNN